MLGLCVVTLIVCFCVMLVYQSLVMIITYRMLLAGCSLWRAWRVNCVLSAEEIDMCEGERPLTGDYIARAAARRSAQSRLQVSLLLFYINFYTLKVGWNNFLLLLLLLLLSLLLLLLLLWTRWTKQPKYKQTTNTKNSQRRRSKSTQTRKLHTKKSQSTRPEKGHSSTTIIIIIFFSFFDPR